MVATMQCVRSKELDTKRRSSTSHHFEEELRRRIVGQDAAVQALDLMQGGLGFVHPESKSMTGLDEKVERAAVEAARKKFSPEFINRLDSVVVFHPLKHTELDEVLSIELERVQKRVLESTTIPFVFRITNEGREFLLDEGTDPRYGARHLKRAMERRLVCPLTRLLATAQLAEDDLLVIDRHPGDKGLSFMKDRERRPPKPPVPFVAHVSSQLGAVQVAA